MKKRLLKILFLAAIVIGLSMTAFGQKGNQKKPKKGKNTPKILVPKKKKRPKNNKRGKKKKPQVYSKFIRSKVNSTLS